VAEQGPRLSCILLPGPVDDHGKVIKVLAEIVDVAASTTRSAMTTAVKLGHCDSCGCEGRAHVAIESTVCGEAMRHDQGQVTFALGEIVLNVKIQFRTPQPRLKIRFRSGEHLTQIPWTRLWRRIIVPPHAMRITEIYASIHGESQYAGLPCTLVRTTGCDLRCTYCDTTYAFAGGQDMSVEQIIAEVKRFALPFVLLTGGEPMLQAEIVPLAERLLVDGYKVAIETSGAHLLDGLPKAVFRIVDVKTPSSGQEQSMKWQVLDGLRFCDAAKFVLADETDYRWSVDHVVRLGLATRTEVLFSPVHGQIDAKDLVAWIVRDQLPVRVNLQLHKYIWGRDTRGV
jgi:7-carboxy-7-deazaguanine synthase